jgi:HD superfamily phosphodiesterase
MNLNEFEKQLQQKISEIASNEDPAHDLLHFQRVVQTAKMLCAIGLARCFATAGLLRRSFYSANDPFCEERAVDDSQFTIDHF